jgi:hypothetical protein
VDVVELVELVLQLVDLRFQSGHLAIHVSLLQGRDVGDFNGGRVEVRLRAVPGVDTSKELGRGLPLGQVVDVPLGLPAGLAAACRPTRSVYDRPGACGRGCAGSTRSPWYEGLAEGCALQRPLRSSRMHREAHVRFLGGASRKGGPHPKGRQGSCRSRVAIWIGRQGGNEQVTSGDFR